MAWRASSGSVKRNAAGLDLVHRSSDPLYALPALVHRACPADHAHHLVFDGWWTASSCGSWPHFYVASLKGQPDPLPPPSIQYSDFARDQRRRLRKALEKHRCLLAKETE